VLITLVLMSSVEQNYAVLHPNINLLHASPGRIG